MSNLSKDRYLIKRGDRYHYQQRPPSVFKDIFKRKYVQITLKTDSLEIARQRAAVMNSMLEEYWESMAFTQDDPIYVFHALVKKLKQSGFKYIPFKELVTDSLPHELINRVNAASATQNTADQKAILGITQKPDVTIDNISDCVFSHERLKLSGKTKDEQRKYKNPILKAIKNFKNLHGNIKIEGINRGHILTFKEWWVDRIIEENLTTNSANKDFSFLKKSLRIVSDTHTLNLKIEDLFSGITLKNTAKKERLPFEACYIQNTLLKHDYKNASEEVKCMVFAMADTGCRIKELVGLEDQDVFLDEDIPYIWVRPNETRKTLKTQPSERKMPLVGSALHAFQSLKGAFKEYHGRADAISAATNKYLKENNLLPSSQHTLYSLRHSFEDRLTVVEPPEKIQAQLMGHKFSREKYGKGATLEQKKKWLDKIALSVK